MIKCKTLIIYILLGFITLSIVPGNSYAQLIRNLPDTLEKNNLIVKVKKKKKKNQVCHEIWLCIKDNRRPGLTTSCKAHKGHYHKPKHLFARSDHTEDRPGRCH